MSVGVSTPVDNNDDGIVDSGGCMDLNGYWVGVQNNFMTLYELDPPWPHDLIQSIYFPDTWAVLTCTPETCFAVGDANLDGWIDDISNQFSSDYLWPTLYQDNNGVICYPTDPGVPCKRIDATVRVGKVSAFYSPPPPPSCSYYDEQICNQQGGTWDPNTCTCSCFLNGEWTPCSYY